MEIFCDEQMQTALRSYVLRVDECKFTQVVRNLVSNALKFTPRGGSVAVCVETVPVAVRSTHSRGRRVYSVGDEEEADPLSLRLTVRDTGAGISQVSHLHDVSYGTKRSEC